MMKTYTILKARIYAKKHKLFELKIKKIDYKYYKDSKFIKKKIWLLQFF